MIVIIKSAPDTADGKRGVKLARDMAADIVLLQNGVYFAQRERLEGFCGTVYALEDDIRLRGLREDEVEREVRKLDCGGFVDLAAREDKVLGLF